MNWVMGFVYAVILLTFLIVLVKLGNHLEDK